MAQKFENFSVDGFDQIYKAMKNMPWKLQKKVLDAGARKGAQIIRKEAKRLAPFDKNRKTGRHLRDLIKVGKKVGSGRRLKPGNVVVGIDISNGGQHAHLIEFGTGPRFQKNGRYTGQVKAQPFMRPAFDSRKYAAIKAIQEEMVKRFSREVDKLTR